MKDLYKGNLKNRGSLVHISAYCLIPNHYHLLLEEVKEGGENRFVHRLPAPGKFTNLVLKRGMLVDSGLITWFRDAAENFSFRPTTVLVSLLNEEHEPLESWNFVNAWPVKWSISNFKSTDNAVVIETVELVYDFFHRELNGK